MIRKLFCILVCELGLIFILQAQSLSKCYSLAEELQRQGQWEQAIEVYKRVIFFDKDQTFHGRCYQNMGDCAEELGWYIEADRYLNFAYYLAGTLAEKREIQFQQIRIRLLNQDFIGAQEELWILGSLEEKDLGSFHLFSFVAAFGQESFDSAQFHLDFFISENDSLQSMAIELFDQNEKVSRITARKARIMSMILPGLGQFYAGEITAGLNSLGLTSALLLIGIQVAIRSSPLDAAFAIIPWFVRYYQGGYERAGKFALDKQKRRRAEIYQELLFLIEQSR